MAGAFGCGGFGGPTCEGGEAGLDEGSAAGGEQQQRSAAAAAVGRHAGRQPAAVPGDQCHSPVPLTAHTTSGSLCLSLSVSLLSLSPSLLSL